MGLEPYQNWVRLAGFLPSPGGGRDWLIDTRVHMLKPGWLPCIGGWHLDFIKRDASGKLLFEDTPRRDIYLFVLDFGTGSLPEYADAIPCFPWESYGEMNGDFVRHSVACESVRHNCLYRIDTHTPHRGVPATGSGWRYFFRAADVDWVERRNELRTQTQVYVHERDWERGW